MILSSPKINFSIVIPTFNRSDYLKLSLRSTLRQKDVSFEVIVGDNGSTDDTQKVVKSFKDKRIKYYKNKTNLGYALNLKKCLENSTGEYVFILADDDFILGDHTLSDVIKVMRQKRVGVGRIGSIAYDVSPRLPYRITSLSNRLIILRPEKEKDILLKIFDFGLGFPTGLILENSLIEPKKIMNYMGHSYMPLVFDVIKKHGIVYIPNLFIVAHLSLRDIPTYFSIKNYGTFFIEEQITIVKNIFTEQEYNEYKRELVRRIIILLPNIKFFSNNKNYAEVLKRMVKIDPSLLSNPVFLLFGSSGFLPRFVIKKARDIIISHTREKTLMTVKKYNYFRELDKLEV